MLPPYLSPNAIQKNVILYGALFIVLKIERARNQIEVSTSKIKHSIFDCATSQVKHSIFELCGLYRP